MSLKKKGETFADAAKRITKKYPRAEYDKIDKQSLDRELAYLAQEQEEYKAKEGIGQEPVQGGQMWGGGFTNIIGNLFGSNVANPMQTDILQTQDNPGLLLTDDPTAGMTQLDTEGAVSASPDYSMNITGENPITATPYAKSRLTDPLVESWEGLSDNSKAQMINSLLGGTSSLIGNIVMNKNRVEPFKPTGYRPSTVVPVDISYQDERDRARRDDALKRNIATRNIQNSGGSAGQRMASIGYANAASQRVLNELLGRSYQKENEYNANAQQRARLENARERSRGQVIDEQRRAKYFTDLYRANEDKNRYTGAMFSVLPSMMKDLGQIMNQDQLIKTLGRRYKYDNKGNIVLR